MRRLLALAIAGLGLFTAGRALAILPRSFPKPSPSAGPLIQIDGIQYLHTADFLTRVCLKTSWIKKNVRISLQNDRWRLELEADSREARLNGVRVFLGDAARLDHHALWVSRIDAWKLLTPLLHPGADQSKVPELSVIAID